MTDENWENRLSPSEYESDKERDLNKERKKPLPRYKMTKEDKRIIKEQRETAKDMEQFREKEMLLRRHAKEFPIDDYSMLLYRLPINKKQMKAIYNNLVNENSSNNK